ncbi:MAG: tRNA1(Val) (adenine(37)-N6)-methyltransferase [Clostridia bacterium]|nr:tRNA1(Val) (adenine(37)-N6)-methyltransferase [Clostridia bacterium]
MELKENERIDDLEFKGYKIIQNTTGFCFGIDSVLLSDYAKDIKSGAEIIDIGTGTGIIGILLTGKTNNTHITGIEIQSEVADMARRSIKLNGIEDRFCIKNMNIKDIFKEMQQNKIDAIVTNPPYMRENTGAKNIEKKKLISRCEVECTLEDIIKISYKLLKSNGEFYMVHRAERIVDILFYLRQYKLEPKKIRFVHSKVFKEPNLVLIKCVKDGGNGLKIDKPLIVYDENGKYTDEILEIYNKKGK